MESHEILKSLNLPYPNPFFLRFDWVNPQLRSKSNFHRWSRAGASDCYLLCRFWNGSLDSIHCICCWSWRMAPSCDRNLFRIVKRHNPKINFTCRSTEGCIKTLFLYETMFEHSRNQSWGESFEIITLIILLKVLEILFLTSTRRRNFCWWNWLSLACWSKEFELQAGIRQYNTHISISISTGILTLYHL